jgi:septal ring factor EnvC (AmiA/AmiB activator)
MLSKRVRDIFTERVTLWLDSGRFKGTARIVIPKWVLYAFTFSLTIVFSVSTAIIAARIHKEIVSHKIARLEKNNQNICKQYAQLETEVLELTNRLSLIENHDCQLRILNNMNVPHQDIRKMGIGGSEFDSKQVLELRTLESGFYPQASKLTRAVDEILRRTQYQKQSFAEVDYRMETDQNIRDHTPSIVPTKGHFSSGFGYRIDPITRRPRMHTGFDISNKSGTPIWASADGVVCFAGWLGGYGWTVKIDHGNGITTLYGHMSAIQVKEGQMVQRGQPVGSMGKTGRAVGNHLHYEVRIANNPVNPRNYFVDIEKGNK